MITTNAIDPKVWQVSKVQQVNPIGVLRLTIKQDNYNPHRDNADLLIADYYSHSGDPDPAPTVDGDTTEKVGKIIAQSLTEDGYLKDETDLPTTITTAMPYYFKAIDPQDEVWFDAVWRVKIDGFEEGNPLQKLVHLTKVSGDTVMLKIAKSSKIKGKTIVLSVTDKDQDYYSSIKLEVIS